MIHVDLIQMDDYPADRCATSPTASLLSKQPSSVCVCVCVCVCVLCVCVCLYVCELDTMNDVYIYIVFLPFISTAVSYAITSQPFVHDCCC